MRTLITGGTGTLGRALLADPSAALAAGGAGVLRVLSRRSAAPAWVSPAVEWATGDLATGAGLAAAVDGMDVVIHAASDPLESSRAVDAEGTARLAAAARAAGVRHLLYVSIVGIDRIPFQYYEHKLMAERVIEAGVVPWTIVRATQFHDFLDWLFPQARWLLRAVVPRGWRVQPIDPAELAAHLWAVSRGQPAGRTPDAGGPQALALGDVVRRWFVARGEPLPRWLPVGVRIPGAFSDALRDGANLAPSNPLGRLTWDEWLERRYPASARSHPGRAAPPSRRRPARA